MSHLLADAWFQRALVALLLVQLLLVAILATLRSLPPEERAETRSPLADGAPRPERPTLQEATGATAAQPAQPTTGCAQRSPNFVINDNVGKVGHVRLGMTLRKAEGALCEELVPLQRQGNGSADFRYAAPKAGLELRGTKRKIDTIVVTNVGKGPKYRTTRGVAIRDGEQAVGRAYTYAYLVCGAEWWVERGDLTLKFNTNPRVTSITLTNRQRSPYVECP